jgi:hypothetical protein
MEEGPPKGFRMVGGVLAVHWREPGDAPAHLRVERDPRRRGWDRHPLDAQVPTAREGGIRGG